MPAYEYECEVCRYHQERVMKVKDHYDKFVGDCPSCGSWCTHHQIIISPPSVEDWGNGGQGRTFEHLGPQGKTFHDKASYQRYLKEKGLVEWSPKRGMPGCDP